MKNNTKNIRKGVTAILVAVVMIASIATLTVSPALASADPITVDQNSSIESKTWNYVHWGHWATDNEFIAAPGSGTTYAAHTHRSTGIELDNSTTTYTATTATTPCEYQLAFDMTMDNWLIWGGISNSQTQLNFSVTNDTDYDISGSYTTDANQGEDFDVYLKDLGTDTFVFQHENTPGTLSGSNLTGTIPPGDYEFYVKAESKAEGPWTWSGYPSKYGPISGGAEQGIGSVHLGLTAQVDVTPPDISVTVSPDMLWPPNHKMVDIVATVTVSDICDVAPTVVLTSVTSDEPDDAKGNGDGKTVNDIQGVEIGAEDYEFQLRAERAGNGDGRIYTITYTATDESENSASASATVMVPHDRD